MLLENIDYMIIVLLEDIDFKDCVKLNLGGLEVVEK